jgi:ABC-type transporter Mla MlaB component
MTNWSYDDATQAGTLTLQGELTIRHVNELKSALLDALDGVQQITVDVSSTTEADVAGVQLLYACRRFATSLGKKMCLRAGDNSRFSDFLEEAGFPPDIGCNHGAEDKCS